MLLVDAGNTRFKAAFADDLTRHWAVVHDGADTVAAATKLFDLCYRTPQRVVISCVSNAGNAEELEVQCRQRWGLDAQRLVATKEFESVKNGYADYRQLGVDRWAAVVAAWYQVQGAAVVVDCGTAVTVDTVAADGRHLGGVIFPGLQLSAASFFRHTHNPPALVHGASELFATNTAAAVGSGVHWAVVGGINALLDELVEQLPPATPVLLTGGDAAELLPFLRANIQYVEHLVFKGMALIAGFWQEA